MPHTSNLDLVGFNGGVGRGHCIDSSILTCKLCFAWLVSPLQGTISSMKSAILAPRISAPERIFIDVYPLQISECPLQTFSYPLRSRFASVLERICVNRKSDPERICVDLAMERLFVNVGASVDNTYPLPSGWGCGSGFEKDINPLWIRFG